MGLAETQRSVIGRELVGEPLGTVWIYCSYPVVATGLRSIFEKRARVHVGLASPAEGAVPSCAIFDAGGVEVRRRAYSVSGGSPGNPDPWSPACTWTCRSPPWPLGTLRPSGSACRHGALSARSG